MIDRSFACKYPTGERRAGFKYSDRIRRERGWVFAGDWQQLETVSAVRASRGNEEQG